MSYFLFIISTISQSVGGVGNVIPAGELGGRLFFYISVAFIISAIIEWTLYPRVLGIFTKKYIFISVIIVLVIVSSSLINYESINNTFGMGMTGWELFFRSAFVLVYMMIFFIFVAHMLESYQEPIEKYTYPFILLSWILILVALLEIFSWYNEPVKSILVSIRTLYSTRPEVEPFRVAGLDYETSFYTITLISCIPALLYSDLSYGKSVINIRNAILLVILGVSGSRTAMMYLALATLASILFVVNRDSLRKRLITLSIGFVLVLGPLFPFLAQAYNLESESLSNLTRTLQAASASQLGFTYPFGFGFGQANIQVAANFASRLIQSQEIELFLTGARGQAFSPVYSWYARTICEIGFVPYYLLVVAFCIAIHRVLSVSVRRCEEILVVSTVVAFQAASFSFEGYHFWSLWQIVLVCCLVYGCSERNKRCSTINSQSKTGLSMR
ncbi:hypothetical protein ANOBCDAF_04688 [Pleomorphomonas sp. T1.2MG-36]|nr:hypothetical protein ANOBCDAF_04688 [Pleomorphomonas sp. T1.2MG-36]